ncbi:hypothetical protein EVG20_g9616 [Dentipellis fragilis]|uniref:Uncharacterized protein n=1 Tax=Dentipellis fragilis TaxID=205917 RepID=A0A4Y9XWZ3_9AGAM|nr:hypothetical protein EVG20_g9616 [Dentipellis fragilis]
MTEARQLHRHMAWLALRPSTNEARRDHLRVCGQLAQMSSKNFLPFRPREQIEEKAFSPRFVPDRLADPPPAPPFLPSQTAYSAYTYTATAIFKFSPLPPLARAPTNPHGAARLAYRERWWEPSGHLSYAGRVRNSSADCLLHPGDFSYQSSLACAPTPHTPAPARRPRSRSPRYRAKPRASGYPICSRPTPVPILDQASASRSRSPQYLRWAMGDALEGPSGYPICPSHHYTIAPRQTADRTAAGALRPTPPHPYACQCLPTLDDASFFARRSSLFVASHARGVDRARGCGSGTVRPRCSFAFVVWRMAYVRRRHLHLRLHLHLHPHCFLGAVDYGTCRAPTPARVEYVAAHPGGSTALAFHLGFGFGRGWGEQLGAVTYDLWPVGRGDRALTSCIGRRRAPKAASGPAIAAEASLHDMEGRWNGKRRAPGCESGGELGRRLGTNTVLVLVRYDTRHRTVRYRRRLIKRTIRILLDVIVLCMLHLHLHSNLVRFGFLYARVLLCLLISPCSSDIYHLPELGQRKEEQRRISRRSTPHADTKAARCVRVVIIAEDGFRRPVTILILDALPALVRSVFDKGISSALAPRYLERMHGTPVSTARRMRRGDYTRGIGSPGPRVPTFLCSSCGWHWCDADMVHDAMGCRRVRVVPPVDGFETNAMIGRCHRGGNLICTLPYMYIMRSYGNQACNPTVPYNNVNLSGSLRRMQKAYGLASPHMHLPENLAHRTAICTPPGTKHQAATYIAQTTSCWGN